MITLSLHRNKPTAGLLFIIALSYLGSTNAGSYSSPIVGSLPGQIALDNVLIIDNLTGATWSTGAILQSLDNNPLYGGQVYELQSVIPASTTKSQDATYGVHDTLITIPQLSQNAWFNYNMQLIKTNDSPLQFTVVTLSVSLDPTTNPSKPIGAGIIGTPGPKGDTGAQEG
jgi:hypothetical protein